MKILVVVDMQNDFIDGALGSLAACEIVAGVDEYIGGFAGRVIFTRDTHGDDYMSTSEGKKLPVPHCIKDTHGWQISEKIRIPDEAVIIDKETFGSLALIDVIRSMSAEEPIEEIELVGLCTDICVISNAYVLKAAFPNVPIAVNARLCRGVTEESHNTALSAMQACHIDIKQ